MDGIRILLLVKRERLLDTLPSAYEIHAYASFNMLKGKNRLVFLSARSDN